MPSPLFPNRNKSSFLGRALEGLGQLGKTIGGLLRPQSKPLAGAAEESEAARFLAEQLGMKTAAASNRLGWDVTGPRASQILDDIGIETFPDNQPSIEGPINVESSNVHSFAYEWNLANTTSPGNLLVRFLGGTGKLRVGPGALYRYHSVPYAVFRAFRLAASAGTFVWDELRVRGTVAGHQYNYDLADIGDLQRVPRQAGFKRGQVGEFYMPRTFHGQRSTLPERHVRGPRGTLPGFDNAHKLQFRSGTR